MQTLVDSPPSPWNEEKEEGEEKKAKKERVEKDSTVNRVAPHGAAGKQAAPTEDYMTRSCVDDVLLTGGRPLPVKNTQLIPVWNHGLFSVLFLHIFFYMIKYELLFYKFTWQQS